MKKTNNLVDQVVEKTKELQKLETLNAVLSDAVKKAEAVTGQKPKTKER